MKIIDSHQHIGECTIFDHKVSEQELLEKLDENGVSGAIVLPFPGDPDERRTHDAIYELSNKFPGKIYGVISLNPRMSEDEYFKEVERCVNMGFKGIKLHPFGHACPLNSRAAEKFFIAARNNNLPVIIHTGLGVPYTLPSMVIPKAMEYKDVKIVLAHAGAYIYSAEALIAAQLCPNIYLETSWCSAHRIREFVEKLGPERVMFGSDIAINIPSELAKYRSQIKNEYLEICLQQTAEKVFKL